MKPDSLMWKATVRPASSTRDQNGSNTGIGRVATALGPGPEVDEAGTVVECPLELDHRCVDIEQGEQRDAVDSSVGTEAPLLVRATD